MLIGIDVPRVLEPFEVIRGENEKDPFGIKTRINWVIFGLKKLKGNTI